MKLQLTQTGERKLFTGYGDDHVLVNRERYGSGSVIHADAVLDNWGCTDFSALTVADFDFFLALQPDVVLLGTGTRQRFAHPALYRNLLAAGVAVECMDTAAVCRTYNILVAEDRRVVAAILL